MNVLYLSRQSHIRWRLAFFFRPWSLLDVLMYLLLALSMYKWYVYLNNPIRESFSFTATHYQDLDTMAGIYREVTVLQSLALLVAVVRMIEFFERFQRLKFIVDVIAKSSQNV